MRSLSKLQFLVLTALLESPMHAYAIRQSVINLTSLDYFPSHSSVINAIHHLRKAGLVDNWVKNPYYWFKARRGEPYNLTSKGLKHLEKELEIYHRLLETAKLWQLRNKAFGREF
jgi:DNA-binding PadR family transcriptional regulator